MRIPQITTIEKTLDGTGHWTALQKNAQFRFKKRVKRRIQIAAMSRQVEKIRPFEGDGRIPKTGLITSLTCFYDCRWQHLTG